LLFAPFDTNFLAYVAADGTTWIRDPRTPSPADWHSLDSVPFYPTGVVGVTLTEAATPFNTLLITVLTSGGGLAQTRCTLTAAPPPPGPGWAASYCKPFGVVAPPPA
jgi:hypothetical protein